MVVIAMALAWLSDDRQKRRTNLKDAQGRQTVERDERGEVEKSTK
jgi:hypothetical protein